MKIEQILDQISELPEASQLRFMACITEVRHPKGHILLRADKIETSMYFIKKGLVRAFADLMDREITFWFGKEGDPIISMKSYVENQKGYEYIELLEDCELYELKIKKVQQLFSKDIDIANWGRKFAEQELIKTEERLISRQFRKATERYHDLVIRNSDLIQSVQLGYIASYLGITQVSLSRIRAQIR